MNTNRRNQQDISDNTQTVNQQAQGRSTGPGDVSEARSAKATESWDQVAARLAGVGDRPGAEQAQEQRPAQQEPARGQPDASEVEKMTADVRKAWGLSEKAETAERSARPTASAEPPVRPDIRHLGGSPPQGGSSPGAWEHFSGGVRDGLGDFVSRLFHGGPSPAPTEKAREPEPERDGGLDR